MAITEGFREIALRSRSEKIPQSLRLCRPCGARSKNGNGPCRQAAMANGRCRFHGGKIPPTPKGSKFALKHGLFTAEDYAQSSAHAARASANCGIARKEASVPSGAVG